MSLPYRYRIKNSIPGSLRPSTLPPDHGCFTQFWIFTSELGRTHVSWKPEKSEHGTNPRSPTFQAGSFNHCTMGPRPSFPWKTQLVSAWQIIYIYLGANRRQTKLVLQGLLQWRSQKAPPPPLLKSPLNWLKFTKKSWGASPKPRALPPPFSDPGSATVLKGYLVLTE